MWFKNPQAELDWNIISQEIGPRLLRFFCLSFDRATSADLVQETLIRAWKKAQYQEALGAMELYLFGFARLIRLEQLRKLYSRKECSLENAADITTDQSTVSNDEIKHLKKAIGTLSETEQEVIGLILNEELSYPEISLLLQIPVGTLKSHYHRAKEKLKPLMENIL